MSHDDTQKFIFLVLSYPFKESRFLLNESLKAEDFNEGQFYSGIVKHGPSLKLTTAQWFELLSRLPNRVLRSQIDLHGVLSEEQIKKLPPITG